MEDTVRKEENTPEEKKRGWYDKKGNKVWTKKEKKENALRALAIGRKKKVEKEAIKRELKSLAKVYTSDTTKEGIAEKTNRFMIQAFWDDSLGGYEGFVKWINAHKSHKMAFYTKILPNALQKLVQPTPVQQQGVIFNLIGINDERGEDGKRQHIVNDKNGETFVAEFEEIPEGEDGGDVCGAQTESESLAGADSAGEIGGDYPDEIRGSDPACTQGYDDQPGDEERPDDTDGSGLGIEPLIRASKTA